MKKLVLMQKQMISTRERHAEHLFTGQNTQHMLAENSAIPCNDIIACFCFVLATTYWPLLYLVGY